MARHGMSGVTCESCGRKAASKILTVRRGDNTDGYDVRVCSGCAATYQETFGDEVEAT